jgi:hypothetical protein
MIFEEKLYDRVGGLQFDQIIKIENGSLFCRKSEILF